LERAQKKINFSLLHLKGLTIVPSGLFLRLAAAFNRQVARGRLSAVAEAL
jgi:hypothetical protein